MGIVLVSLQACARQPHLSEDRYIELMMQGLEKVEQKINESGNGALSERLEFSANLMYAHGAFIKYFPIETLKLYVDAIKEAGAGRVDINPSIEPWVRGDTATIAKYDQLMAYIRQSGLRVALNPVFNRGEGGDSFSDWRNHAIDVYRSMAQRYRPDIFVVVHEPTTMQKRMRWKVSTEEWIDFARESSRVIHEASPRTLTGAGGQWYENQYLRAFAAIHDLRYITLNIYSINQLRAYNQLIQRARRAGKEVYIAETWRPPYAIPGGVLEDYISTGIGAPQFAALDEKWLSVMTKYAVTWKLSSINPFWTQTFFAYAQGNADSNALSPSYNKVVAQAIAQRSRTSMFQAYSALARRYGR